MSRQNRILTATLYCYVEPTNAAFAKTQGRQKWGSFSNYINHLLAKEKGDKASQKRSVTLAEAAFAPILVKPRKSATKMASKKKPSKKSKPSKKAVKRVKRASPRKAVQIAPEAKAA